MVGIILPLLVHKRGSRRSCQVMEQRGIPILIEDANDFEGMLSHPAAHYLLSADIDMVGRTWDSAVVPWFGGQLDGNYHSIRFLNIEGGGERLGLLGFLSEGAMVKRLRFDDVSIDGCGDYVGVIAGYNAGLIDSCSLQGSISGRDYTGGLIGFHIGTIESSFSKGSVSGRDYVGGLLGYSRGVSHYHNENGPVTGIHYCYSHADTTGSCHIGGLVGRRDYSTVYTNYSTGRVVGEDYVGGLIGSGWYGGGYWDIETSGQIESAGYDSGGRTTNEMQDINNYRAYGWDFESIWMICEGDYPHLQWENVECSSSMAEQL